MKVLVACEFSGVVRDAFLARGHDAISCDLLPTESPGLHYQGDVFDLLNRGASYDLIIMHPPCTALAVSGNSTYGEGQPRHAERLKSAAWTRRLWDAALNAAPRVALENPVGVLQRLAGFPRPQYVQPWQFGHLEQKKTGLFLYDLPPLIETDNVYAAMMRLPVRERQRLHYLPPSSDPWNIRSTTFQGIADAMAAPWGALK